MSELVHFADCALVTTYHLTCTCGAWTRWRALQVPKHAPNCSWVQMGPYGNKGSCDCGMVSDTTSALHVVSDTCPDPAHADPSPTSGSASPG